MDLEKQIIQKAKEAAALLSLQQYDQLLEKGWLTEERLELLKEIFDLIGQPTLPHEDIEVDVYEYNDGSGYGVEVRLWIDHLETDYYLQAEVETDLEKTMIKRFYLTDIDA